ncbi:MAG TPA: DDE-type integrase/transposase/recombinase [Pirellulales bacterium]|nr:DDE-type integrase/transposase/recombinase [Pirellulales bacterium]
MSVSRRQSRQQYDRRRQDELSVRRSVAAACGDARQRGVPAIRVTSLLAVSDRTVRRWPRAQLESRLADRGRPARCASREERNAVYRFLCERGPATPLAALQAEFPELRRADLQDLLRRYRRIQRRKAERLRSRLEWRRPGAVWAADFKERREPLEGRYGWLLSIKDLASRCQLTWLPVEEATEAVVQATYLELFAEHGPPLVLKSDNGGPFRADETKRLLAEQGVAALFSPRRHPQYNGGVERANGQLSTYQEAVADYRGRSGMPTRADAESARQLANALSRPEGWRGPTSAELWAARTPAAAEERAVFTAAVEATRSAIRAQWNFAPDEHLGHYAQAAVDRKAVRDALVAQDLLRIHPRRKPRINDALSLGDDAACARAPCESGPIEIAENAAPIAPGEPRADKMQLPHESSPPAVGGAAGSQSPSAAENQRQSEEAQYSTNKPSASGQN